MSVSPPPSHSTPNLSSYVWLAPIYADAARPAASSINLVVQQTRDPNHGEFARNASGDYCYLVPTVGGDVKIYDLALYRTTVRIEDELPLGFDGCSEDLETEPWMDGHVYTVSDDGEEEGEYEYLYLVWKTHLA